METYKSNCVKYSLVEEKTEVKKVRIRDSANANTYAHELFDNIGIYESVYAILLNRANITKGFVKISQGGITGSIIDVKLVAKHAIESLASGVILVHNHPSCNNEPSESDRSITRKVKDALSIIDTSLLDHVIITPDEDSYYSFADNGQI